MHDSDVRPTSPLFPPAPDAPLPHTGYVLLWFPLASETFIFHEVRRLAEAGLPVRVYTMYASRLRGCSDAMRSTTLPVRHFGVRAAGRALVAFCRSLLSRPRLTARLMRDALFHRLRGWETRLEAIVCFFYGFLLAEEIQRDGIELLHAAWGNGPATAAWVASRLTGVPFSFTGRANDIYPQDGILPLKARDALFIRTNNRANGVYLRGFCPADQQDKVHVVYNGLTLGGAAPSLASFMPDYQLLSIGRFVPKKGFDDLLAAVARGTACPAEECPKVTKHLRPSPETEGVIDLMYAVLRLVSEKSGVATQLIATRDDLLEFLQDRERSRLASGWRWELAGRTLAQLLSGEVGLTVKSGRIELL